MEIGKILNIFYKEPDPDRWLKYDRYPRKIIRKLFRGPSKPGGVQTVALNLLAGLDKLNIPYRFNDFSYIKKHPDELACIIGKPQVLLDREWLNPILFGAGIFSHPIEYPDIFARYPQVKHMLVPGEWICEMFKPYYGTRVSAWPTGIDTDRWNLSAESKEFDFLIYNKIRWDYNHYEKNLLKPIKQTLEKHKLNYHTITYGNYTHEELAEKLKISKAVIFLCEHETQGIAYQQILSCNVPILAWDRGGFWRDPYYFPHKVKYEPVTSVPYWDERCGIKFKAIEDFENQLKKFLQLRSEGGFNARSYILENLTLEKCALKYLEIVQQVMNKEG